MNILELRGVSLVYGRECILENIDFTFSGGIAAVTAEPGAGKTVLCDLMTGIIRPTEGRILRRCSAAAVSHSSDIPKNVSIRQIIKLTGGNMAAIKAAHAETIADAMPEKMGRFDTTLARLCCALSCEPELIICDDACKGLSERETRIFADILRETKLPLVIIGNTVISADQEYVLSEGRLRRKEN